MALETQLLGISRPELLNSAQVLKNMGHKRWFAGPEEGLLNSNIALLDKRNHLVSFIG